MLMFSCLNYLLHTFFFSAYHENLIFFVLHIYLEKDNVGVWKSGLVITNSSWISLICPRILVGLSD